MRGGTSLPLLPGGEKVGMSGLDILAHSRLPNPLTLPSPRWGEGK
jgi:hypothetical protein